MKELHVEGLATHDDPESCAAIREDGGEALTGARAGRVLSREIRLSRAPTPLSEAEGNSSAPQRERRRPCAVEDPEHVRNLSAREPGDPMAARRRMVRRAASERPRPEADDARRWEVGRARSTCEVAEQSRACRRRRRWREGARPRGTRASKTRPGLRAGQDAHNALDVYAKQHEG